MRVLLMGIYPEKVNATEPSSFDEAIRRGYEKARYEYGLSKPNHYALIAMLMFLLGHKYDEDPLLAWADRDSIMAASIRIDDQWRMMQELERRVKLWIEVALESIRFEQQMRGE